MSFLRKLTHKPHKFMYTITVLHVSLHSPILLNGEPFTCHLRRHGKPLSTAVGVWDKKDEKIIWNEMKTLTCTLFEQKQLKNNSNYPFDRKELQITIISERAHKDLHARIEFQTAIDLAPFAELNTEKESTQVFPLDYRQKSNVELSNDTLTFTNSSHEEQMRQRSERWANLNLNKHTRTHKHSSKKDKTRSNSHQSLGSVVDKRPYILLEIKAVYVGEGVAHELSVNSINQSSSNYSFNRSVTRNEDHQFKHSSISALREVDDENDEILDVEEHSPVRGDIEISIDDEGIDLSPVKSVPNRKLDHMSYVKRFDLGYKLRDDDAVNEDEVADLPDEFISKPPKISHKSDQKVSRESKRSSPNHNGQSTHANSSSVRKQPPFTSTSFPRRPSSEEIDVGDVLSSLNDNDNSIRPASKYTRSDILMSSFTVSSNHDRLRVTQDFRSELSSSSSGKLDENDQNEEDLIILSDSTNSHPTSFPISLRNTPVAIPSEESAAGPTSLHELLSAMPNTLAPKKSPASSPTSKSTSSSSKHEFADSLYTTESSNAPNHPTSPVHKMHALPTRLSPSEYLHFEHLYRKRMEKNWNLLLSQLFPSQQLPILQPYFLYVNGDFEDGGGTNTSAFRAIPTHIFVSYTTNKAMSEQLRAKEAAELLEMKHREEEVARWSSLSNKEQRKLKEQMAMQWQQQHSRDNLPIDELNAELKSRTEKELGEEYNILAETRKCKRAEYRKCHYWQDIPIGSLCIFRCLIGMNAFASFTNDTEITNTFPVPLVSRSPSARDQLSFRTQQLQLSSPVESNNRSESLRVPRVWIVEDTVIYLHSVTDICTSQGKEEDCIQFINFLAMLLHCVYRYSKNNIYLSNSIPTTLRLLSTFVTVLYDPSLTDDVRLQSPPLRSSPIYSNFKKQINYVSETEIENNSFNSPLTYFQRHINNILSYSLSSLLVSLSAPFSPSSLRITSLLERSTLHDLSPPVLETLLDCLTDLYTFFVETSLFPPLRIYCLSYFLSIINNVICNDIFQGALNYLTSQFNTSRSNPIMQNYHAFNTYSPSVSEALFASSSLMMQLGMRLMMVFSKLRDWGIRMNAGHIWSDYNTSSVPRDCSLDRHEPSAGPDVHSSYNDDRKRSPFGIAFKYLQPMHQLALFFLAEKKRKIARTSSPKKSSSRLKPSKSNGNRKESSKQETERTVQEWATLCHSLSFSQLLLVMQAWQQCCSNNESDTEFYGGADEEEGIDPAVLDYLVQLTDVSEKGTNQQSTSSPEEMPSFEFPNLFKHIFFSLSSFVMPISLTLRPFQASAVALPSILQAKITPTPKSYLSQKPSASTEVDPSPFLFLQQEDGLVI